MAAINTFKVLMPMMKDVYSMPKLKKPKLPKIVKPKEKK